MKTGKPCTPLNLPKQIPQSETKQEEPQPLWSSFKNTIGSFFTSIPSLAPSLSIQLPRRTGVAKRGSVQAACNLSVSEKICLDVQSEFGLRNNGKVIVCGRLHVVDS